MKLIPVAVACLLSGCSLLPRAVLENKAPPVPKVIDKPDDSLVVGVSDAMDSDLRGIADEDMFISIPLQKSAPLPDIKVRPFSVSNASINETLRTALAGTQLSYSIDNEHPGAAIVRRQVSAYNVTGDLSKVLDMFSDSVGYYYTYTDGVLHISPDRQYIAKLPPVNELFDSIPVMLKTLGATSVFVDKTSRTVTYRATKPEQRTVDAYLRWVRDNKRLIVYETFIAEVVLNDAINTGIQWNKLSWMGTAGATPLAVNVAGGGGAVAAAGNIGVGAVFNGAHFSMDALASFLQTQGTVNQISKIPMMLVAGGDASFRNGGTDYYVSSIGAPTVAMNGQVIQGQSQLSPLHTGIDLKLSGDIYDGTVFTHVNLGMNTLTGYKPFPAGSGQSMSAPITSDRMVTTSVRVRPGDTILIAGINYEKYQSDIAGMPGGKKAVSLTSSNSRVAQRSELVIVMRPKIVQFVRHAEVPSKAPEAMVKPPVLDAVASNPLAPVKPEGVAAKLKEAK